MNFNFCLGADNFGIRCTDESHMSSYHNNRLLVDNGGIPKIGKINPNEEKFGDIVEHTL